MPGNFNLDNPMISVQIGIDLKKKLIDKAKKEDRTFSNLVRKILKDFFKE